MSLLTKPIDQITEQDFKNLVSNQVLESRVLDYKETLPNLQASDDKREFIYDVSAFANGGGGELIYGISEVAGKPANVVGVHIDNADQLIRQVEEIIRSNVQPRIYGIQIRAIPLPSTENSVFIIRIPNSLNSPHMASMGGTTRFYTRNSAGKHPMDITEIRSAFLSTMGISERLRDLRLSRIAKIKANDGYMTLSDAQRAIALHLVPFSALGNGLLDVSTFKAQTNQLWPMLTDNLNFKYNFDGFITFAKWPGDAHPHTYTQLTRQGMIEAVENGYFLRVEREKRVIYPVAFEKEIINQTSKYLIALSNLGVQPPFVIMVSLLGVRDFTLTIQGNLINRFNMGHNQIDKDDLLLPELMMENFPTNDAELARLLRPVFDTYWNAAGFSVCMNYNADGDWIEPS
ncbi:AlbA family DNA-binding domain-containing protein [Paenibacillus sp. MMO-58]|uniref:AlbA family DNA-binding domain-containing protein n=1 Tax=Paenibacillus sp. MMO-58 TaxID=3081290 RepID=UPI003015C803